MEKSSKQKGGPNTDDGKAVSRFNAVKHGLLSKEILLETEDEKTFLAFENSIMDDLAPEGPLEETLADRIISGFWRLRRALYVEKHTMDWYHDDTPAYVPFPEAEVQEKRQHIRDMLNNKNIENILRYESAIERSIFRAFHELERLQADRRGYTVLPPEMVDVNIDKDDSSFGKYA